MDVNEDIIVLYILLDLDELLTQQKNSKIYRIC